MSKTHRAVVVWGEEPTSYTTHEFKTKAELSAFWEGVNAADGWLGAHNVEDIVSDDYELGMMAERIDQPEAELKKELKAAMLWKKHKLKTLQ